MDQHECNCKALLLEDNRHHSTTDQVKSRTIKYPNAVLNFPMFNFRSSNPLSTAAISRFTATLPHFPEAKISGFTATPSSHYQPLSRSNTNRFFSTPSAPSSKDICTAGNGESPAAVPGKDSDTVEDPFVPVFRFPYVTNLAIFNIFKILQSALVLGGLCPYYAYQAGTGAIHPAEVGHFFCVCSENIKKAY